MLKFTAILCISLEFTGLFVHITGASQKLKMSSVNHLVYAVIHFLREQSQMDTFTSDEQESLEGL